MKKYYAILSANQNSTTYFSKTKHGFKVYTDPGTDIIGMDKRDHAFTDGDITNLKRWIKQHPNETKGHSVSDLHVMSIADFNKKFNK